MVVCTALSGWCTCRDRTTQPEGRAAVLGVHGMFCEFELCNCRAVQCLAHGCSIQTVRCDCYQAGHTLLLVTSRVLRVSTAPSLFQASYALHPLRLNHAFYNSKQLWGRHTRSSADPGCSLQTQAAGSCHPVVQSTGCGSTRDGREQFATARPPEWCQPSNST